MKPVYPKDNGSLDRAREAFRKKVANWKWNDEYEECVYKKRGRKPQYKTRVESKPRTKGEELAQKQKYNWL